MKAINDRLAIYRPHIVAEMREIVGDDPARLYSWMRYHLGWEDTQGRPAETSPGKLLRPASLLLAAEALGGKLDQALPAAAAVQLVHDFSLLHDDIEDESETRADAPRCGRSPASRRRSTPGTACTRSPASPCCGSAIAAWTRSARSR